MEKEIQDQGIIVRFTRACFRARYLFLLFLIVVMLCLDPFLDAYLLSKILMDLFLTAIFIAVIYTVSHNRIQMTVMAIFALPLVISIWSAYWLEIRTVGLFTRIFGALFFACAVINILIFIFGTKDVTGETIFAAIDAYLLMALMFAFIYIVLEKVAPGSFSSIKGNDIQILPEFEYFSFVTITTLGYGDIAPITEKARTLSGLEAVTGQIYLVVLVAWLVGMHVASRSKR